MESSLAMFSKTMEMLNAGAYEKDGQSKPLKLTQDEMAQAAVFLPEQIQKIRSSFRYPQPQAHCSILCENTDSFSLAQRLAPQRDSRKEVLVLNMANPFRPGGGVRYGVRAQEEDLCRTSSLLLSLESREAEEYYQYNQSLKSWFSTEAMILTPQAEVFRDRDGAYLDESLLLSVVTCAAPVYGNYGFSKEEYYDKFFDRIRSLLILSAHWGYTRLVLGAWGCGEFYNDPVQVSRLFRKALCQEEQGRTLLSCFEKVAFAVLDRPNGRNYTAFSTELAQA